MLRPLAVVARLRSLEEPPSKIAARDLERDAPVSLSEARCSASNPKDTNQKCAALQKLNAAK
jgi:hypothetical protein